MTTHACSAHIFQKPACFVGQVVNLRRIANPPLCGAANPGCSRLSAGSLRRDLRRYLPQETLPKGSSPARVNAFRAATVRERFSPGNKIQDAGVQSVKRPTSMARLDGII